MERSGWYIGTPSGVVVCIEELGKGQISGRFYHGYSAEPIAFFNEGQLLFQMEHFFDDIRFPYPATGSRSFFEKKQESGEQKERIRVMSDEQLLSRHGDKGTFVIRVQHRQNSSWQGYITWMEANKTVHFRSVWEMMKLIESAMDTVSTQEESGKEPSWFEEN